MTVGTQNIARNDARFGFSWLIGLMQGEGFSLPLVFLRYIVLSLWYGNIFKFGFISVFHYRSHTPGIDVTIRAWGFFMTTPSPSVLWLSRSAKKGQNFSITIGSGKTTSAQNVAGVWGVCGIAVASFHSKY